MNLDGLPLSEEVEKEINEAFKIAFRGKSGKLVEQYIRKITLDSALMPGVTPDEVMHREGARWLAACIVERINRGRNPNDISSKRHASRGGGVSEYFAGRSTGSRDD